MPKMMEFAVFIDRPSGPFRVMHLAYEEEDETVERRIADFVNEKRVKPVPIGGISYVRVFAASAQLAANAARDEHELIYKTVEQLREEKIAERIAAQKKASHDKEAFADSLRDFFGFNFP